MAAVSLFVRDDTKFFERALQEYRETGGDYSNFQELRLETQQQVIVRAQQLKDEWVSTISVNHSSESREQAAHSEGDF